MDPFDDKKVKEFIKAKQKVNLLPNGRIKIQNVESLANKYKICKQPPVTDGWHFWISLRSLTISVV